LTLIVPPIVLARFSFAASHWRNCRRTRL